MTTTQTITYLLDGVERAFDVTDSPDFSTGPDAVLSSADSDLTWNQPWYPTGFAAEDLLSEGEFASLKEGIEETVRRLLVEQGADTSGFTLEKYHRYATTDDLHYCVVRRTRDLFPADFGFDVVENYQRLSQLVGFPLTDVCADTGLKMHIIVRINRPGSGDFNPPHKDAYEVVDGDGGLSPFVNFWLPIAGVDGRSALPMSPGSHHLPESAVLRTREGGVVNGKRYRVRIIQSWGGKSDLERAEVAYGQALVFSAFIIHGLAVNDHDDTTRVALEFRLFRDRG